MCRSHVLLVAVRRFEFSTAFLAINRIVGMFVHMIFESKLCLERCFTAFATEVLEGDLILI